MNPVLVQSIRLRMREQPTEQLVELWTTNDRAMWSPEAFEAVKSLLTERGLRELPPQNEPAPVAQAHLPGWDPVSMYWLGWLRPILWICVGVGAAGMPYALFLAGSSVVVAYQRQLPVYNVWRGPGDAMIWMDQGLSHIVLPLWLLVAGVAGLRLKPWARLLLLWYGAIALITAVGVAIVRLTVPPLSDGSALLVAVPVTVANIAQNLVLPVVLWTFLRRPEIAALFQVAPTGHAFEALPGVEAPA